MYSNKKRESFIFIITLVFAYFFKSFLKFIFARDRPFNLIEQSYAFPSGHALGGMVFYGLIAYFVYSKNKLLSYFIFGIPFLIGLSRLYLNVHWFSDVMAGWIIGLLILDIVIELVLEKKANRKRMKTRDLK